MPIYRGNGGSGDASTDAYASLIAQYADTASDKADEASVSAAAASASETAAELAETNAETAETGAEAAEALAEKWATELEDVEVETGKYSAFHWAQKALAVASATATLSDLIDVTLTSVADDEVLAYDSGTSEWINQTKAEAGFGTAATEDVTTSATDTTAGRLLKVGDHGVGSEIFSSGGNVGIGTTNPENFLHISSGLTPWALTPSAYSSILIEDTSGGITFKPASDSDYAGINWASDVNANSANIVLRHSDGAMRFATGGNVERMRIDSSGNVGIGTASPGSALEVTGAITGTAVTQSAVDTTAGRLLKVGDFGQGNPLAGDPNFDNNTVPGTYYISTNSAVNAPFGVNSFGFLQVFERDVSTRLGQMYIDQQTSRAAYRIFAGTWGRWYEIYGQNSVLGTVSESAGVPTGAVIERGSNANGEYIKFADGTMICKGEAVVNLTLSTVQSFTPPSSFIGDAPAVLWSAETIVSASDYPAYRTMFGQAVSGTSIRFFCDGGGVTTNATVIFTAIGRWFV